MQQLRNFFFFLFLFVSVHLSAQSSFYTIYVGAFKNPAPESFQLLQKLGFVYAKDLTNGAYDVYIGGFDVQNLADQALKEVHLQGYAAAKVVQTPLSGKKNVAIIQVATLEPEKSIAWSKFTPLGNLYIIPYTDKVKMTVGIYSDIESAKKQLPNIQKQGFPDAFVRSVHPAFLHPVGSFEKGEKTKEVSATFQLDHAQKGKTVALSKNQLPPTTYSSGGVRSSTTAKGIPPSNVNTSPVPQEYNFNPQPQPNTPTAGDFTATAKTPATTPVNPGYQVPPARTFAYGNSPSIETAAPNPEWSNKGVIGGPASTVPSEYNYNTGNPSSNQAVRTAFSRRSVVELQRLLKAENIYQGPTDGFYNATTVQAYQAAKQSNPELARYQLFAQRQGKNIPGSANPLLSSINRLGDDASAISALASSQHPLARAYQAYQLLVARGPGIEVNNLMNTSIQGAFGGKTTPVVPPFDYRATYAYNDLNQLILHLNYIHSVLGNDYPVPCWLARRHPKEIAQVQAVYQSSTDAQLPLQSCDAFSDWEDVQLLQNIAAGVGASTPPSGLLMQAASQRARLYEGSATVEAAQQQQLENWLTTLWGNLTAWGNQDPLHQQLVKAMRISFFETQVTIEDYYLSKGNTPEQARGLALATQHTLVSPYLQRFN
jgi:hypothetical protein